MEEIIEAKRDLGNGRWDRILKRKMVELSHADTYEEARDEWEATGRVYNHTHYGNEPEWTNGHTGHCLCGHPVVYHFEIRNTVTGVHECVGSDHIGAYLIIREIVRDTGINAEDVTDVQIQTWLKDRVAVMKRDAWWDEHGEHFNEMYDAIKDIDLVINNKGSSMEFNYNTRRYEWFYLPKKRATGKFGDYGYQMASITWRWDNNENLKNQSIKYGYPNNRLWTDLILFHVLLEQHRVVAKRHADALKSNNDAHARATEKRERDLEKRRIALEEKRKRDAIAWEEGREERERLEKIRALEVRKEQALIQFRREKHEKEVLSASNEHFENLKEYYGLPDFIPENHESHEVRSFVVIKEILMRGQELSASHLRSLKNILAKVPVD
jgi:hypothetical protein